MSDAAFTAEAEAENDGFKSSSWVVSAKVEDLDEGPASSSCEEDFEVLGFDCHVALDVCSSLEVGLTAALKHVWPSMLVLAIYCQGSL